MRWAIQSTMESSPVLSVVLILERRNMEGINRLSTSDRMHQLCRIEAKSLLSSPAGCWYNDRPDPLLNDHTIRVMLVFNQTGLAQIQPDALQALRNRLLSAGARLLDWNARLPSADIPMAAPKLSARYKMATLPPKHGSCGLPPTSALDDAQLKSHYSNLPTHVPDERLSDPSHLVYTDGSKLGTSITGGVYQEAHGIKESFNIVDHDPDLNTSVRAELAALHRALHITRFSDTQPTLCIITDSLCSIHLLNKAIHNPRVSGPTNTSIYSLRRPRPFRLTQIVPTS